MDFYSGRELRPILVLADAGVDQDGAPGEAQDERLDRAFQDIAGEVDEIRLEQAALLAQRAQVEPGQNSPSGSSKASWSTTTSTTIWPIGKRT